MHFGIWQSLAALGSVATNNADKAVLGMYLSDAAVGLFAIPQMMVDVTYSLTNRAAEVLLPAVSEIDSSRGRDLSFMVTLRVGWVLSLITTTAMGCLVIMGDDMLRLYVGRSIAASCGHLLILIALTAIASSSSPAISQYLYGIADTKRTALIAVCSGIVDVVGCALLIPRFGLNGAAVADVAAIVLVRPVMHLLIWRDTGRSVPLATLASYLYSPALVGIPVCLALHAMRTYLGGECGWLGLLMWCGGCSIIIVGAIFLIDRSLPEWQQRRSDSGQVLGHAWKVQRRAMDALVAIGGK
jgi:O-antigen/teichoic acid export membrane protein